MKKGFYIFISLIAIYFFINLYNRHVINEIDKIKEIEAIANNYYTSLLNKDYNKALELVDYGSSDYYDDLEWLNNNKEYAISKVEDYNIISQIEYDRESKMYTAFSLIRVPYGRNKADYNEIIYFIKKGEKYYIYSITSGDVYVNYRSNRNQEL